MFQAVRRVSNVKVQGHTFQTHPYYTVSRTHTHTHTLRDGQSCVLQSKCIHCQLHYARCQQLTHTHTHTHTNGGLGYWKPLRPAACHDKYYDPILVACSHTIK